MFCRWLPDAILVHFLVLSTVALLVGIVLSFCLKRHSARAHQCLLLGMIAAVFMPCLHSTVKHYQWGLLLAEPVSVRTSVINPEYATLGSPKVSPKGMIRQSVGPKTEPRFPTTVAHVPSQNAWKRCLAWMWLILSFAFLLRLIRGVFRTRMIIQAAQDHLPASLQTMAQKACDCLQLAEPVHLRMQPRIQTPSIWCWAKYPVLLVPDRNIQQSSLDWVGIFCHELAHYRRQDHISGLIAELILCVIPWHPLVWFARRRLIVLSEQACDDWVLATNGQGSSYAETLLNLHVQQQAAFLPGITSGAQSLSRRVRRILEERNGNPRLGFIRRSVAGLAMTLLVVGVAFAQAGSPKTYLSVRDQLAVQNPGNPSGVVLTPTEKPNLITSTSRHKEKSGAEQDVSRESLWRARLHDVYRLEEGQSFKYVLPPFIPERMNYHRQKYPWDKSGIELSSMFFCWGDQLEMLGMGWMGDFIPLTVIVERVLGLASFEYNGSKETLQLPLISGGDFVMRDHLAEEVKLNAFEAFLASEFGIELRFERRSIERKAIVATGRFVHHPLAGVPEGRRLHMYADSMDPQGGGRRGTADSVPDFLQHLSHHTNMPVIDRTQSSQAIPCPYHLHHSSVFPRDIAPQAKERMLDLILKNLSQQTEIQFEMRKETVVIWHVSELGEN
jgi:beta-lactamase regulating signal transducer with metallopeptidase domain